MKQQKIQMIIPITWIQIYSSTDEDDEHGRWAIEAIAGKQKGNPFIRGKVAQFTIARIKKVKDNKTGQHLGFCVSPVYPYHGKYFFNTVDECKLDVEQSFTWFLKNCIKLEPKQKPITK